MENIFKIGDIVKHDNNPLKMTVEGCDEQNTYCVFFDNNQKLHRIVYKTKELLLVKSRQD